MRLILRSAVSAVLAALVCTGSASSQATRSWTLDRSEVHALTSAVGDTYDVVVALPRTYESSRAHYPVLIVLDGDPLFPIAARLAEGLSYEYTREIIVVGLSAKPLTAEMRTRNLTPTVAPEPMTIEQGPDDGPPSGGGAPAFLVFLQQSVIPFLERTYRTVPEQLGVFGHSYGGLFLTYVLFRAPETFSRYIISSPSLWWDQRVVLRFEEEFARTHSDLAAAVFLTNGALEGSVEGRRPEFAQLSNSAELVSRLSGRGYKSLKLSSHEFPGEGHMTVIPFSLSRGLRALYPKHRRE